VLYTGGTAEMPKGASWRQADMAVAAIGQCNHAAPALSSKAALKSHPRSPTALFAAGPVHAGAPR
jgi:hypothetical protein